MLKIFFTFDQYSHDHNHGDISFSTHTNKRITKKEYVRHYSPLGCGVVITSLFL